LSHFNRLKKCSRNIKNIFTEEEINDLNNKQIFKGFKDIDKEIKKTFVVSEENINNFKCDFCDKQFNLKYNLNKHIRNTHSKEDNKKNIVINNIQNNTNNTNIQNIQNNINITNISLKIPELIPFDEEWDLSEIKNTDKHLLMISKIMYTQLLEKILENEKNLNIIIDKDNNTGLVYSNVENKKEYKNMEFEKIIEKSMEKINKHLIDIFKDITENFNNSYYLDENNKKIINDKYRNFRLDKNIKKTVENYFFDIFNKNNQKSIQIMTDINNNEAIGF
jgi:hypothetical protein